MRELKKSSLSNLCSFLCGLVVVTAAIGCGGGSDNPAVAPVSGKVTYNGQPVNGGVVQFTPISSGGKGPVGKPATGNVGADGTFKLSSYGDGDGAVVGKHKVAYAPPVLPVDEKTHTENSKPVKGPFDGLMPSKADQEVKAGPNTIDIDLIPDPTPTPRAE
jgi:hypothetical protein